MRKCNECKYFRETNHAIYPFACTYTVLWPKKITDQFSCPEWCPIEDEIQEKSTEQKGS